jgi:hypothetical protein
MKITEQVETIVNNKSITTTQFYNDYQVLMSKYNLLIKKGIVDKRQSQLCSISDKLQLVSLNCNYYRTEKIKYGT